MRARINFDNKQQSTSYSSRGSEQSSSRAYRAARDARTCVRTSARVRTRACARCIETTRRGAARATRLAIVRCEACRGPDFPSFTHGHCCGDVRPLVRVIVIYATYEDSLHNVLRRRSAAAPLHSILFRPSFYCACQQTDINALDCCIAALRTYVCTHVRTYTYVCTCAQCTDYGTTTRRIISHW